MSHETMRGGLKVCCISIGVAAHWCAAQAVRTENVLPASTDPAISGWFGAHVAAFAPTAATRDRLFVYLHGQGGTAGSATELVNSAAEVGFHAVGLTYANDWSPFNVCGGDPACPEALRREIVDGVDRTPTIVVSRANSIENRLIKLLRRLDVLHPGEGWLQFIDGETIRWDLITLWGHSQGGGNAGIIAKHQAVGRVCLSAPAADGGPGSPAAWWASHLTPSASYFGFCHTQDAISTKLAFWSALGMAPFGPLLDVAVTPSPFSNTHSLSTSVAPAVAGQYHNSVVLDALTPRGAGNVPVYKPVWQYMMTSVTTSGGSGPTWNDVAFATVPTSTGTTSLQMDIYAATTGTGPRPLLIWIHGGGWQSGSHNQVPDFALSLRARGISVASIGYRLTGQSIFPTQIHDCKGAVRFLRARAADVKLDPTRFGVWGSSAGGHLAALVATSGGVTELEGTTGGNLSVASGVMVCGDFFGPTDLLTMGLDCDDQSVGCSFDHDAPDSPE
ncbi:MAG: alpha/beta hydrolase, partial [Planctomycetota bacterium]|nr:alpha/beta hydrolase [Planctomycetota bacterium]